MLKLLVKCLLFGISAINVTFAFYLIKNEKDNLKLLQEEENLLDIVMKLGELDGKPRL